MFSTQHNWPSPYFTPGTHTLTVKYLGNSIYAQASSSLTFIVDPIGTQQTTMSLSVDPPAFSTVEDAVATVHVDCNSACGLVHMTVDGNEWYTWPLDTNGNISPDTFWWGCNCFTPGSHTVTANFLGNATYAPKSISTTITVNPIGTQLVAVTLSASSTTFSISDAFYASFNVGCNSACGYVQVTVDGDLWVMLGLNQTGNGVVGTPWASNAYFTPGTHIVKVHFLGDSTYAPSDSSDITVTVTP